METKHRQTVLRDFGETFGTIFYRTVQLSVFREKVSASQQHDTSTKLDHSLPKHFLNLALRVVHSQAGERNCDEGRVGSHGQSDEAPEGTRPQDGFGSVMIEGEIGA